MEKGKCRKILVGLLVIVTLFISLVGVTAYANTGPAPINPDEEQTVKEKAEEFNIDAYQSYMISEKRFFKDFDTNKWVNSIANMFFDLNKIFYSGFKEGINLFGESSIVKDHVVTFTTYSTAVFDTFYKQFGFTIIACMAIYVFYLYFAQSPQRAIKQLMAFSAVLIFAFAWNANAPRFVRWFDDISSEVQGELIRATARLQGGSAATPTGHAQNVLFELAIEEPYLLMNYGTTDKSEIVTIDNPNIITELLYTGNLDPDRYEEIKAALNEQAETNLYLTPEMSGWKLGVSFLSIFGTILLGTPILALQFFNFLMSIMALLLASIMGFAMFLSLLPQFRHLVWKMFSNLIGFFGARVVLGVAFMTMMSLINVIRQVIPASTVGMYLMQILAIFVTMLVIWKYRDKLIKLVSAGLITNSGIGKSSKGGHKGQKGDSSSEETPEGVESPDASTADQRGEKDYGNFRRFRDDPVDDGREAFQDHVKNYEEDADSDTADEKQTTDDETMQTVEDDVAEPDENQEALELEEELENTNEETFGVTDETSEEDEEAPFDDELRLVDDPEQEEGDSLDGMSDEQMTMPEDGEVDPDDIQLDSNDFVAYENEEEENDELWIDPIVVDGEEQGIPEPDLRDLLPTFEEYPEFSPEYQYSGFDDSDEMDRYGEIEGYDQTAYENESNSSELAITVNRDLVSSEEEVVEVALDTSFVIGDSEQQSRETVQHITEQQTEVAEQLEEAKEE